MSNLSRGECNILEYTIDSRLLNKSYLHIITNAIHNFLHTNFTSTVDTKQTMFAIHRNQFWVEGGVWCGRDQYTTKGRRKDQISCKKKVDFLNICRSNNKKKPKITIISNNKSTNVHGDRGVFFFLFRIVCISSFAFTILICSAFMTIQKFSSFLSLFSN